MTEKKRIRYWDFILKETYLSLMGSPEARKLMQEYGNQIRAEKLLAQQAKQNAKALEKEHKEHKSKKLVKV
jgi:hypothetical protein